MRAGEEGFGLVEALISFLILSVGLLAIGGIALSVGAQTRNASVTTGQALAAQQVMELTLSADYSAIPAGAKDTTVTMGEQSYTVRRTVTQVSSRVKQVEVEVPGRGDRGPQRMMTRVHPR